MEVTYQLTQRDFRECIFAHRSRNAYSKWLWRLLFAALIFIGAVLLLAVIVIHDPNLTKNVAPLFFLGLLWLVLIWGLPWWSARKQFVGQPMAQGPRTVALDDAGAHWRWAGGSADVEWRNYARALEGKNQFLLYTSPVCFNILPKRALTPDQLEQVRQLLKQMIPSAR
jgi:hypothetical protein